MYSRASSRGSLLESSLVDLRLMWNGSGRSESGARRFEKGLVWSGRWGDEYLHLFKDGWVLTL